MPLIEVCTFRLVDGADVGGFLDADKRLQTELMLEKPTFLRRTTARGTDGEWLIVMLWPSAADAEASAAQFVDHPAKTVFTGFVDRATISSRRYETLD